MIPVLILILFSFSLSGCEKSPPSEDELHQITSQWFATEILSDISFKFSSFEVVRQTAVYEKDGRDKMLILARVGMSAKTLEALFIYRVNDNDEWEVEGSLQVRPWTRM